MVQQQFIGAAISAVLMSVSQEQLWLATAAASQTMLINNDKFNFS